MLSVVLWSLLTQLNTAKLLAVPRLSIDSTTHAQSLKLIKSLLSQATAQDFLSECYMRKTAVDEIYHAV